MKKNIILFAVIFCLFSGVKAFSQCIVSGGNLKKPIEYKTIESIIKDKKKLVKAARKGDLEMKFPVGSSFRNAWDFRAIFGSDYLFGGKYYTFFSQSEWSECIALSNEEQVDICFYICLAGTDEHPELDIREVIGLISPDQLSIIKDEQERILKEKEANQKAGYGAVTNAERDEIVAERSKAKKAELKPQIDELILKAQEYEKQNRYCSANILYYEAYTLEKENEIIDGDGEKAYNDFVARDLNPMNWKEDEKHNIFEIPEAQDEWRKDSAKFWSENIPFTVYWEKLARREGNYEKKTANYSMRIPVILKNSTYNLSTKFGYRRAGISLKSIENPREEEKKLVNESIKTKLIPEVDKLYKDEKIAVLVLAGPVEKNRDGEIIEGYTAYTAAFQFFHKIFKPKSSPNYFFLSGDSLYEIQLSLTDKNGNIIKTGEREFITISSGHALYNSYEFSDIPAEQMKLLDTGEYLVKIEGLWLHYGVLDIRSSQSLASMDNSASKSAIRKLPEIKYGPDKITFKEWTQLEEDEYGYLGK